MVARSASDREFGLDTNGHENDPLHVPADAGRACPVRYLCTALGSGVLEAVAEEA